MRTPKRLWLHSLVVLALRLLMLSEIEAHAMMAGSTLSTDG